MDEQRRPRILVATEPAVLEGALALLLRTRTRSDVVEFHEATEPDRARSYDAAIVTVELVDGIHADVVITLPGAGGMAHVSSDGVRRQVEVRSKQQVMDLLDRQFPAGPD